MPAGRLLRGRVPGVLTLIPGHILRSIYADFGSRLLERNVRSFLQARGKVNRGIRDTISREPERFLAYNNGITMTAESVGLSHSDGGSAITRLEGLQIVNGGQTTASLLATERGRADLSQVHVAAKLIEINSGTVHDELVRNVSRYANSQNRISDADFSANDPFHVRIEELSRTLWAPAAAGFRDRLGGSMSGPVGSTRMPGPRRTTPATAEGLPGREPHETALRQNRPGKIREHLGPASLTWSAWVPRRTSPIT